MKIFDLTRDIIVVLLTCKNEEDLMKNEGVRMLTRLYIVFSDAQGQLIPKSAVEFLPKFKLIKAFMVVLVTCKNAEDTIKSEGSRMLSRVSPIISLWEFFQTLKGS